MSYSPSKLGKKKLCPKFDYKETDPEDESSAAAKGTLLHEAFATGCMAGLNPDEVELIAAARLQSDGFAAALPQPVQVHSELKVGWEPLGLYGTADKVYIGGDRALVSDLKTGRGGLPDDADDSEQVVAYILGVFAAFPRVETVDGILVNPTTREVSERMTVKRSDIPAIVARLEALIAKIEDPFEPPTPGSHCTDCQHVARCWALAPTIKQTASVVWPLTPAELDPTNVDLDPGARSVRALLRKYLESWCEKVKEADNSSGVTPPGWKRIDKTGAPQVAKENRVLVFERLVALGLSPAVVQACSRITLGEAVEQLRVTQNLDKDEAKTKVYDAIKDLTTVTMSSYIQRDKKGLSDSDIAQMFKARQLKGGTGSGATQ